MKIQNIDESIRDLIQIAKVGGAHRIEIGASASGRVDITALDGRGAVLWYRGLDPDVNPVTASVQDMAEQLSERKGRR